MERRFFSPSCFFFFNITLSCDVAQPQRICLEQDMFEKDFPNLSHLFMSSTCCFKPQRVGNRLQTQKIRWENSSENFSKKKFFQKFPDLFSIVFSCLRAFPNSLRFKTASGGHKKMRKLTKIFFKHISFQNKCYIVVQHHNSKLQ